MSSPAAAQMSGPPTGERQFYEQGLRVAVEGCGHGTLNAIYASIEKTCALHNYNVDLLIICGDFQAVRNAQDLHTMSVPVKYRQLGDFHEYYSGARKAPILTIFIGGNHEASAYGTELFYGGWVCPNIYYLGAANVLNIGGLRIAGLSGIYEARDYIRPHYERLPYMGNEVRTIYHVRDYDKYKLFQVSGRVDVGLSHDWPQGIEHSGDVRWLLREKPWFGNDIKKRELGSPPARSLLYKLKPRYWFSGHLHVKFAAVVHHGKENATAAGLDLSPPKVENPDAIDLDDLSDTELTTTTASTITPPFTNSDEIDLDMDDEDTAATVDPFKPPIKRLRSTSPQPSPQPSPPQTTTTTSPSPSATTTIPPTYFLALDKCLPHRSFLQILEIPTTTPPPTLQSRNTLSYDPEWLAITRAFNPYLQISPTTNQFIPELPQDPVIVQSLIDKERKWVSENVKDLTIYPEAFTRTAPAIGKEKGPSEWKDVGQPPEYNNPQTAAFCQMLQIPNKIFSTDEEKAARMSKFRPGAERSGWMGTTRGKVRGGIGRAHV